MFWFGGVEESGRMGERGKTSGYAQELFLTVNSGVTLGGAQEMLGIESELTVYKANSLTTVLSFRSPPLLLFFIWPYPAGLTPDSAPRDYCWQHWGTIGMLVTGPSLPT